MVLTLPDYAPRHVEVLEQELRRVCGLFALEPRSKVDGLVRGDVGTRRLGRFDTALVALDAERVRRDAGSVRREPGEHLFLLIQDRGRSRVVQRDSAALLGPGDMFLVDSALPSDFDYAAGGSAQTSIHLPRDEMLHRFGRICAGGRPIHRDDPLWTALSAVVAKMAVASPETGMHLAEAFLGLLGAYFHDLGAQVSANERATSAVLSRALAVIDRHCLDADFGARELAAKLNVSERTLQRHFQSLGETASRRILNVRLATAHARLLAARSAPGAATVANIAFESGFNDLSYFYREFRARYGVPPGTVTKQVAPESNPAGG
jgi:AraC-like DNA-binding protein